MALNHPQAKRHSASHVMHYDAKLMGLIAALALISRDQAESLISLEGVSRHTLQSSPFVPAGLPTYLPTYLPIYLTALALRRDT